jgi:hypothetical protein
MNKVIKLLVKQGVSEQEAESYLKIICNYYFEKGREVELKKQHNLKIDTFEDTWENELKNK